MSNFVTRAVAGLSANAQAAWRWAKAKVESFDLPAVHPNDVLGDVLAYLDAHGLNTGSSSFDHWKAAVRIARVIADDAGHLATKAVAGVAPHNQVLLIAFAVEEVLKFLASKGQAGLHETNPPSSGDALLDASIAGVFGKIAELEKAEKTAVAGKIEPKPDGPKGAA